MNFFNRDELGMVPGSFLFLIALDVCFENAIGIFLKERICFLLENPQVRIKIEKNFLKAG